MINASNMASSSIRLGHDEEMPSCKSKELQSNSLTLLNASGSLKVRTKQYSPRQNPQNSKLNGPQALSTDPAIYGAQAMDTAGPSQSQSQSVSLSTSLDPSMSSFSTNVNLPTYLGRLKYVDEATLKRSFSCAICADIVHEPQQTHCGQRVCLDCIREKFEGAETIRECPLTHDEEEGMYSDDEMNFDDGLHLSDFPPDRYARTHLLKQKVFCPNGSCEEVVIQKRLVEHLLSCDYTKRRCENENCEVEYLSKDEVAHKSSCPHARIRCPDCGAEIIRHNQADHSDEDCPNARETQCGCGRYFKKRSELRAHQSRSSLEQCSADANVTGACGYQAYGCENQEETNAAFREHISSKVGNHLEKITLHLESSKRNMPNGDDPVSVNQKVRPLDYTVADLHDVTTKMKVKMQETEAARGGLDNMDKQMKVLVADMKIVIDKQKSGDTQLDDRIRGLERTIDKLQTEINNWSASVPAGSGSKGVGSNMGTATSLSSISSSLNSKGGARSENLSTSNLSIPASLASSNMVTSVLSDVTNIPNMNGELIWVIEDYTVKRQRAVTGEEKMLLSQPFYTSRNGYKMRARVYLYGDGTNRGKYMSIYFVMMRGKSDYLLSWPFKRRISFAIVKPNKSDIGEKPRVYVPDNGVAFLQPVQEQNPATGCPDFMEVNKVRDDYVNSRDQLVLIVTVEPQPQSDSFIQKCLKWKSPRGLALDTVR